MREEKPGTSDGGVADDVISDAGPTSAETSQLIPRAVTSQKRSPRREKAHDARASLEDHSSRCGGETSPSMAEGDAGQRLMRT